MLRASLQATAPLVFGVVAAALGGASQAGFGSQAARSVPANHAQGLECTFLLMLIPLAAAGLILILARRTYRDDVAAARESEAAALVPGTRTDEGRRA